RCGSVHSVGEVIMTKFRFAPACASETMVFGAERPGYPCESVGPEEVSDWIRYMKHNAIRRIGCLLPSCQLNYYASTGPGLLKAYNEAFGPACLLHEPVPDLHLCTAEQLAKILAFLDDSVSSKARVVVHCSGGIGRTGHVLAGWVIHSRGLTEPMAIKA